MSDIFLVLAGLMLGLSFLGGPYLWFIPFGIIALVFGWLNRPKKILPSLTRPITDKLDRLVRIESKGTEFISLEELIEEKSSQTVLQLSKSWQEVENDVEQFIYETLVFFKSMMPNVYTAAVFFPSKAPGYFELKAFCSESSDVL